MRKSATFANEAHFRVGKISVRKAHDSSPNNSSSDDEVERKRACTVTSNFENLICTSVCSGAAVTTSPPPAPALSSPPAHGGVGADPVVGSTTRHSVDPGEDDKSQRQYHDSCIGQHHDISGFDDDSERVVLAAVYLEPDPSHFSFQSQPPSIARRIDEEKQRYQQKFGSKDSVGFTKRIQEVFGEEVKSRYGPPLVDKHTQLRVRRTVVAQSTSLNEDVLNYVPLGAWPDGCRLELYAKKKQSKVVASPRFHMFLSKQYRGAQDYYCYCVTMNHLLSEREVAEVRKQQQIWATCLQDYFECSGELRNMRQLTDEDVFAPHSMVLITARPFHDSMLSFLRSYFEQSNTTEITSSVVASVWEVVKMLRTPAAGQQLRLPYLAAGKMPFRMADEAKGELPVLDLKLGFLLGRLDARLVVHMLNQVSIEESLLIISKSIDSLTYCVECMHALLFPIPWQFSTYQTFLAPEYCRTALQSIQPFFFGALKQHIYKYVDEDASHQYDLLVVDVDNNLFCIIPRDTPILDAVKEALWKPGARAEVAESCPFPNDVRQELLSLLRPFCRRGKKVGAHYLRSGENQSRRLNRLIKRMRSKELGVDVLDRTYYLETYDSCLIGSEAVEWVMNQERVPRTVALRICQRIFDRGHLSHVVGEHLFLDDYKFYRWVPWQYVSLFQRMVVPGYGLALQCDGDSRSGYPFYFTGQALINWMLAERIARTRKEALRFGKGLCKYHLIRPMLSRSNFSDSIVRCHINADMLRKTVPLTGIDVHNLLLWGKMQKRSSGYHPHDVASMPRPSYDNALARSFPSFEEKRKETGTRAGLQEEQEEGGDRGKGEEKNPSYDGNSCSSAVTNANSNSHGGNVNASRCNSSSYGSLMREKPCISKSMSRSSSSGISISRATQQVGLHFQRDAALKDAQVFSVEDVEGIDIAQYGWFNNNRAASNVTRRASKRTNSSSSNNSNNKHIADVTDVVQYMSRSGWLSFEKNTRLHELFKYDPCKTWGKQLRITFYLSGRRIEVEIQDPITQNQRIQVGTAVHWLSDAHYRQLQLRFRVKKAKDGGSKVQKGSTFLADEGDNRASIVRESFVDIDRQSSSRDKEEGREKASGEMERREGAKSRSQGRATREKSSPSQPKQSEPSQTQMESTRQGSSELRQQRGGLGADSGMRSSQDNDQRQEDKQESKKKTEKETEKENEKENDKEINIKEPADTFIREGIGTVFLNMLNGYEYFRVPDTDRSNDYKPRGPKAAPSKRMRFDRQRFLMSRKGVHRHFLKHLTQTQAFAEFAKKDVPKWAEHVCKRLGPMPEAKVVKVTVAETDNMLDTLQNIPLSGPYLHVHVRGLGCFQKRGRWGLAVCVAENNNLPVEIGRTELSKYPAERAENDLSLKNVEFEELSVDRNSVTRLIKLDPNATSAQLRLDGAITFVSVKKSLSPVLPVRNTKSNPHGNYGVNGDMLWVDSGCKAVFEVTTLLRARPSSSSPASSLPLSSSSLPSSPPAPLSPEDTKFDITWKKTDFWKCIMQRVAHAQQYPILVVKLLNEKNPNKAVFEGHLSLSVVDEKTARIEAFSLALNPNPEELRKTEAAAVVELDLHFIPGGILESIHVDELKAEEELAHDAKLSGLDPKTNAVMPLGEQAVCLKGHHISNHELEYVAWALRLPSCKTRALDLSSNNFDQAGLNVLFMALQSSQCMISALDLSRNSVGPFVCCSPRFRQALEANASLTALKLNQASITDRGVKELAAALLLNHSLLWLELRSNDISSLGAVALSKPLRAFECKLAILDLSYNDSIQDQGVQGLCKSLESNTALKSLRLRATGFTKAGALALALMLKKNKGLRTLDISENKFGFKFCGDVMAVTEIVGVLEVNSSLTSLKVSLTFLLL